jgi:hypothetical protein
LSFKLMRWIFRDAMLRVRGVLRFGVKVPDAGERRDGGVWEKGFVRERVRVEMGRVRYA